MTSSSRVPRHQWEPYQPISRAGGGSLLPQQDSSRLNNTTTQSIDIRSTNVQFLNSGLDVGFAGATAGAMATAGVTTSVNAAIPPSSTKSASIDSRGASGGGTGAGGEMLKTTHSNSYILFEAQGAMPEAIRTRASEAKATSTQKPAAAAAIKSSIQDSTYTVHSNGELSKPRRLEKGESYLYSDQCHDLSILQY